MYFCQILDSFLGSAHFANVLQEDKIRKMEPNKTNLMCLQFYILKISLTKSKAERNKLSQNSTKEFKGDWLNIKFVKHWYISLYVYFYSVCCCCQCTYTVVQSVETQISTLVVNKIINSINFYTDHFPSQETWKLN